MATAVLVKIGGAILGKICEPCVAPVGRQLCYFVQFDGNVETLKKELEKLGNLKDGVEQQVVVDRADKQKKIFRNVEAWLINVGAVEVEAQKIVEEKAQFPLGCMNGWCFNLKTRYTLSRRAKKKTEEIVDLRNEGDKFGEVSCPAPSPEPRVASASTGTFHSRDLVFTEIMAMLKDDKINMIGICGMGGVGKTTMANEIFDKVIEQKLFDKGNCAKAVISQKANYEKVQSDIADMLGLKLHDAQNPVTRAALLRDRLEKDRVLIYLDDVWEEFDLKQYLGINLQGLQKGGKVLFTSRVLGLWSEHNAKIDIPLPVLTKNEAGDLFESKVDDSQFKDNTKLQQVAKDIVKECGGLPLALVTIAGALRRQPTHVWRDTLRQLRIPYPSKIRGIYDKVYQSLTLSYALLKDDDAKSVSSLLHVRRRF